MVSQTPAKDETGVNPSIQPLLTYNTDILASSLSGNIHLENKTTSQEETISAWVENKKSIRIAPNNRLSANTRYLLYVNSAIKST